MSGQRRPRSVVQGWDNEDISKWQAGLEADGRKNKRKEGIER
jgi:hypothetical protein